MTWGGRVHFIGIGGAGMSAIAKVLLERGIAVSGSDLKGSRITAALEQIGADIRLGHDAANVDGAAQVVFSAAINESNRELVRAREIGLEIMTRGEALAKLLEGTRSVVVAGTHGKTTTTSMIVSILQAAGRDPTYLVGGGLNDAGTNARSGGNDLIVAESDESDGSFLLLAPTIAVITNVELDHVDHWSSMAELRDAFERFVRRIAVDGTLVLPHGDSLADKTTGRAVIAFGTVGDISAEDVASTGDGSRFALVEHGTRVDVTLQLPGRHNIVNALAAAGAARAVGLSLDEVAAGLRVFRGVERRYELKGESGGVTVVDDYAHHPTEVRATLAAAGEGGWSRVVAVFQPHRYTRTRALSREFGSSFESADRVVVTEIYGAGEPAIPGVTGKLIADAIAEQLPGRPVAYFPHRSDLTAYLVTSVRPGDLVLTLGAGDITSLGAELLDRLGQRG